MKNQTILYAGAAAIALALLGKRKQSAGVGATRQLYGGNSGYQGYSMSKRAVWAREDGEYPKTDFKKIYQVPEDTFRVLSMARGSVYGGRIIDEAGWHHTSKYGNKTTFYAWGDEETRDAYYAHKKEIDKLCKEYRQLKDPINDIDFSTPLNTIDTNDLNNRSQAYRIRLAELSHEIESFFE